MFFPKTFRDVSSTICLFDDYTATQRLLSELALRKFPSYFDLLPGYDTVCVHRDEIETYVPFHKALYAIKTMTTKLVEVVDLSFEETEVLYEGLLYVDVKFENKAISFKVNLELAPHWEDILCGPFKSRIIADCEDSQFSSKLAVLLKQSNFS